MAENLPLEIAKLAGAAGAFAVALWQYRRARRWQSLGTLLARSRTLRRQVQAPVPRGARGGGCCGSWETPAETRSEREPCGELDLVRRPVGRLQTLDAIRRIRVDAALEVERVEGVHVHSHPDPFRS